MMDYYRGSRLRAFVTSQAATGRQDDAAAVEAEAAATFSSCRCCQPRHAGARVALRRSERGHIIRTFHAISPSRGAEAARAEADSLSMRHAAASISACHGIRRHAMRQVSLYFEMSAAATCAGWLSRPPARRGRGLLDCGGPRLISLLPLFANMLLTMRADEDHIFAAARRSP